jgi:HEAT repeat protein
MSHIVLLPAVLLVLVLSVPVHGSEEAPSSEAVLAGLSDPAFAVRRDAVWAARVHPDPAYLERLLVMARKDSHPNIRAWSLETLTRYEDARVLPTLEAALADDPNPFPKDVALESLGRLRAPGAWETLVAHLAPRARGSAVMRGLAALGDPRAFDVVLALWDAHPDDPYVAPAAPGILAGMDVERATRVCLERFAAAPTSSRRELESMLGERGGEAVREAMVGHLASEEVVVRQSAVRVLGRVGDEQTDALLLAALRTRAEDVAVLARALARRVAREATPVLATVLLEKGYSPETRAAIAGALGALGDARGVEALARALPLEQDALAAVRMAVALGRIGDARGKGALRERFRDPRVSRQPATISSVWVFPWNCRVGDAALWAWATIENGKAPFDHRALSGFPEPPAPHVHEVLAEMRRRAR